jgi:hypothetical protein
MVAAHQGVRDFTFVFPDTGQLLHCVGTKTSACLSPAPINAVQKIHQGPRNSLGEWIRAPAGPEVGDHADNTAFGYAYDGGFMSPSGPATDEFDTPLVAWGKQGIASERVIASGTRFTSPAAARGRPLCPYPQETHHVGAAGGKLADASNYACVAPKRSDAVSCPSERDWSVDPQKADRL